MKKGFFYILFFWNLSSFSQVDNATSLIKKREFDNKIRLNYTSVRMPTDKVGYTLNPTMGLIGLHYTIPINQWLYTGAAMHAAITGDQGGLFTLGVDLGINTKIYKHLYFDANIHFGGGGGYRSLVVGGGFIYPNIGLQYKRSNYSFGVQYGQVDFFTGLIKSDNISFFVEIPSTLRSSSYKNAQKTFAINNTTKDAIWKKPAIKSVQQITFDYFFPIGSSRTDASTTPKYKPITNTLAILGFEYQRYLTDNTFVYAHIDAMYSGLVAGFMDLFFGIGKNLVETKYINFFGKFGIGAAGGRIYPEGGLTIYPNIGTDIKLTDNFGVSAHGGYHRAIGGSFEAYTAGFSIKYYGLSGGISHPFTKTKLNEIKTQGIQIGVQNQTYLNVRRFGLEKTPEDIYKDLQLIALKIYYDLNKNMYLTGEASFAYKGESGGYAHGIFGLGLQSNPFFSKRFSAFLEVPVGVAGGGRVDTGQGIIIKPTLGINYHLNSDFALHTSLGRMLSPFGNANATNINVGLTYGLSILNAKK